MTKKQTEKDFLEIEAGYRKHRVSSDIYPYISQREGWDCGVACMAMALNKGYWEVRADFPKRSNKGISGNTIVRYIGAKGLKRFYALKPLTDFLDDGKNYILLTKSNLRDWGHYVVKDAYNNIYDPEDGIEELEDYRKQHVAFCIEL